MVVLGLPRFTAAAVITVFPIPRYHYFLPFPVMSENTSDLTATAVFTEFSITVSLSNPDRDLSILTVHVQLELGSDGV